MRNHGTDPSRRFKLMRERVEAMKAIWTKDEAEYHGEFVDFDPIWCWPKPLQQPHPPVLVGGNGPEGDRPRARATATSGSRTGSRPLEELKERIDELRERAGRHVPVSFFGVKPEPRAAGAAGRGPASTGRSSTSRRTRRRARSSRLLDGFVALR